MLNPYFMLYAYEILDSMGIQKMPNNPCVMGKPGIYKRNVMSVHRLFAVISEEK